ncbi:isoprenylcysteine carboxylmethyltransferase family protein [Candidatus Bathyarchaeota archaeon]|nr:isoprenylcysteine carboxylmethyltransferase family protein [Candidatus Bathyarchaeota archaeon]MBL7169077.1 isoprenylcysteine carboxylmethyltransferase family protein [Candidatus Bathyarchaeota archaeon]
MKPYAEVERPKGIFLTLAATGTVTFFAEAIVLMFIGFSGDTYRFLSSLQLHVQYDVSLQLMGIVSMGMGVFVFIWSVISRGRYAVSWEMPEDHALITWGPYRYVRHPSYLGYFLMVVGLFLTWLNLVAIIPFIAIPGYMGTVPIEEDLLVLRFGEEYLRYMQSTDRFLPSLFRRKNDAKR